MGFEYRRDASGIVVVTMDMDGQSANTMNPVYHDLMGETVARLEAEPDLVGVVFASAKKTFFAGGDLHGLMAVKAGDAAYKAWLTEDKGYLRRLDRLPVPVVAAINGAALGGGFEICLGCNHRIIVDDPAAVVGLPEVTLGLLPGAGGVARLPYLLPLDPALDLLLSGRFVQPQEALSLGLVDQVVPTRDDLVPAAKAWILGGKATHVQPWDADRERMSGADLAAARALIATRRSEVLQRTRGKLPAPMRILDIVEQGLSLDMDATLQDETDRFATLLGLPETRASIWLTFFAANAVRSGRMRPEGERTKIGSLTVIGSDPVAEALAKAAGRKVDVARGAADSDMTLITGTEAPGTVPSGVVGVQVTGLLSDLTIDGVDPARLFGFRIPDVLPGSKVVEIIAGDLTGNDTLRMAYDLFQRIGHTPVVVQDRPGQFIARLHAAYAREAQAMLDEGLAAPALDRLAYDTGLTFAPEPGADAPDLPEDGADRLLFIQSLEALRCLDEGVIATEEEADLASVLGAGFPPHTGGAIRFVRGLGAGTFTARLRDLATRHGERFTPDPDLLDRRDLLAERAA